MVTGKFYQILTLLVITRETLERGKRRYLFETKALGCDVEAVVEQVTLALKDKEKLQSVCDSWKTHTKTMNAVRIGINPVRVTII